METIRLTEEDYKEARARLKLLPIFERSYHGKVANEVGVLGEIAVEEWLKNKGVVYYSELDKTTHDYRLGSDETFDVKTKARVVPPRDFYDCSVPLYNHAHQQPDYYVFVSLQRDKKIETLERFHTAFVLGGLSQVQLKKYGKVWKEGEVDDSNGLEFLYDCINTQIKQLTGTDEVIEKWRGYATL